MHRRRVLGSGEHALGVEPDPEPGHVPRLILVADGVERLVPGRQDFPGGRVEVAADRLVPDRQLVTVVLDGGGVGPPDLVVGGGQHPAQLGAGDGAADGEVDVRGEAPLGFDGGEVLHVVAEVAAQVLDEPVEQRGEGQRVPGRPVIVVGGRVGGCAVLADPAVGRAGQGDEQGGAEGLAVRRGVGLAHRARADLAAGQVRGVLAAPGRAVPPRRAVRGDLPAHARLGDLLVQLGDELVQVGGVLPGARRPGRGAAGLRRASRPTTAGRRWPGPGSMSGSSSRCQPSRHCAARSVLARSAQDGQTCARVCPHGTSTVSTSPVSRLVRRSWIGRMQAPCSTARSLTTSRASGIAIRCARVVLTVAFGHWSPPSGSSPVQVSAQPHRRHSAHSRGGAVVVQDQAGGADRARLIGPPRGDGGHAATSGHSTAIRDAPVGQGADVRSR